MPRCLRKMLLGVFVILCVTSNITCYASAPEISAKAYILMEAESGRVLLSHNETQELSIASTTKIMTALVALEHSSLSDVVTVKDAHLKEGSSMYLRSGEKLTMEQLLYGLMLPSGNDAAECIADFCGGGVEQFVVWMNEKAAQLGMSHTSFANPSGLDQKGHYSCAQDMAVLAARALREPTLARLVSTVDVSIGSRSMHNHNKLLGSYPGCIGLKTGYTGDAGRTLVTCAERDGMRLIAVTLYDGNDWQDHKALYDFGFSAYQMKRPLRRGESLGTVAVRGGKTVSVQAVAASGFGWPCTPEEQLTVQLALSETVSAPVHTGDMLGEAILLQDGAEIGRVALLSNEEIEAVEPAEQSSMLQRLLGLFSAQKGG